MVNVYISANHLNAPYIAAGVVIRDTLNRRKHNFSFYFKSDYLENALRTRERLPKGIQRIIKSTSELEAIERALEKCIDLNYERHSMRIHSSNEQVIKYLNGDEPKKELVKLCEDIEQTAVLFPDLKFVRCTDTTQLKQACAQASWTFVSGPEFTNKYALKDLETWLKR